MTIDLSAWPAFALCGDCLRINDVADLKPDDNSPPGRCPACNGDNCCSCESCLMAALGLTVAERQRVRETPGAIVGDGHAPAILERAQLLSALRRLRGVRPVDWNDGEDPELQLAWQQAEDALALAGVDLEAEGAA